MLPLTVSVHCSSKNLTKIPSDIPKETILLDLHLNDIRYILLQLELRDNDVTSMHPNAFSGLYTMKLLDLSGNKIRILRSGLFKDISNLQVLRLSDNTIKLCFLHV